MSERAPTKRNKPLTTNTDDMVAISTWIVNHKDIILNHSQTDLCRMIKTEIGVKCTAEQMGKFEKSVGVIRMRGNMTGAKRDRAVVIAKELIRFMESLDFIPSDDLKDISIGK